MGFLHVFILKILAACLVGTMQCYMVVRLMLQLPLPQLPAPQGKKLAYHGLCSKVQVFWHAFNPVMCSMHYPCCNAGSDTKVRCAAMLCRFVLRVKRRGQWRRSLRSQGLALGLQPNYPQHKSLCALRRGRQRLERGESR